MILGLAASCVFPQITRAENGLKGYPIRLVVGFATGGPTDIVARVVGAKLADLLGTSVVVDNRVGASGNIASEIVARSEPDGHTLLLAPLAFAVNETLFPNRHFEYDKDFAAVAPLAETANVLVVHPSLPVKSVAELIAWGKTHDILYATAGQGTATHLAGELFGMSAGIKMTPVHYKGGGDLLKDILSGEVKVTFSTIPPVRDYILKGDLRGLATTGLKRDKILPDLPTLNESGLPGYDMRLWLGLIGPKKMPPDVIAQLAAATNEALKEKDVVSALDSQGFAPLSGSPSEFDTFMRKEIGKWAKVIHRVGIKTE
jgi:tripartite-type tricarboxylate transporter receptor subunit TctC